MRELAQRDIVSYVGERVTDAVWVDLQQRLPTGWTLLASPTAAGWHIAELHVVPLEEEENTHADTHAQGSEAATAGGGERIVEASR